MMDKRNLLKLMVLALGVSVLLFVFGYPRGEQPIDEHTIRYVIEQEPSTLDPAKSTTSPEATVQLQLFDGLVRLNDESEPEAALAKSWDISDDGREYTFHLRPDLKWSNGEPLTAHDFEYAWKRVLDPEVHADNAYMLYVLKNGEAFNNGDAKAEDVGVKAIDDDTLVVTLENPTAYFLKLLASHSYYPVSQKAVEAHENWAANADTFVSNGPYRLLSWKHNGEMDFIKNPDYWDADSVKTEKMNWPISESQSTRLTLVEGGEADMTVEPPVADQKRLEEAGLLHIGPMLGNYYYVFNVKAEPFTDPEVRKAFSMVINRANIVNNIVRGGKEAAYAFVPYGMLESNGREDFREAGSYLVYEDVEQAKEILKQAGYDKNHPLPPITILYNTSELHKAIAEAVQDAWVNAFEGTNATMMIISISACMAGAVCGDHCSPISDTTIMASAGAQCNHINHVSTQLPYAITVALVSFVTYIIAGFFGNSKGLPGVMKSPVIPLVIGLILLYVVLQVIKAVEKKKDPIDAE